MSIFKRLIPSALVGRTADRGAPSVLDLLASHRRRVEPTLPPPTGPGKMRIHLFAGDFASHEAAWHYCFFTEQNRPEDLTRELPDAYIDTKYVEMQFARAMERLEEFLLPADVATVIRKMDGANTLVIIAEPAFAGLAYALYDTPRLRYLGPMVVDV